MSIRTLYERLMRHYGPQGWWPAEHPFEVIVGALLVQQTTWTSVKKAIAALDGAALLHWHALADVAVARLEGLIRPAGFYRTKARRLKSLSAFVRDAGGIDGLRAMPTGELRATLLDQAGIGPETADAILLYAFARPAPVIDVYTRRLIGRLGPAVDPGSEHRLREEILAQLASVDDLNEFHALVVEHGKRHCRKTPSCSDCILNTRCAFPAGIDASAA